MFLLISNQNKILNIINNIRLILINYLVSCNIKDKKNSIFQFKK